MRDSDSLPIDSLLDRQKMSWLEGKRPAIEDFLDESLQDDTEVLLDLLYNEILVREEIGEQPALDEYVARYPHLRDEIRLHFEVHSALRGESLNQTQVMADAPAAAMSDTVVESEPRVQVGPRLDGYEMLGTLGRGGMGVVYRARQLRLRRDVAIKMFQPGRRPSPRELSRFQTEAEAIARLQHPNIIQIFDVGQREGLPYLALELADGGTLAQQLKDGPLEARPAAELIETLALAAQHAHGHNIVHRDLKPANVLFTRTSVPKITDFGLAKILEDDSAARDVTHSGEPVGTPRYMAPEQAAGRPEQIGPATDVHALGMILYECLTGQVPFLASTVVETLQKIRYDEPVSPRKSKPSIPRDLETICLKCLQKDPRRRYPTAGAVADDVRRFLNGEPIHARPTPCWEQAWMWVRRRPQHAALAGVAAFLILFVVVGGAVWRIGEARRIEGARQEFELLMLEAKSEYDQANYLTAADKIDAAKSIVNNEPTLERFRLSSAGWFNDKNIRDARNRKRAEAEEQWNPK